MGSNQMLEKRKSYYQKYMDHFQLWSEEIFQNTNIAQQTEIKKKYMRELRKLAAFPNDQFREKYLPNINTFGIVPEITLEDKRVKRDAYKEAEKRIEGNHKLKIRD